MEYNIFNTDFFQEIRLIVDLHTCIQGEGLYAGVPHILVRFTGCNLNCMFSDWICDTAYASWKPENGMYSYFDLVKLILDNPQISHAFITGGEPTIHPDMLKDVVEIFKKHKYFVAIETNGTKYIEDTNLDFITMSPKLKNSVPVPDTMIKNDIVERLGTIADRDKQENNRYKPNEIRKWMENHHYQFKFVVTNSEQLKEVKQYQQDLEIPTDRIYLMPEGVTAEQLQKRRPWLIETCIKEGYNYTDRLHIVAYDNKRIA